jgi:hypothetical protein
MAQAAKDVKTKEAKLASAVGPLWTAYRVRWDFLTRLCGSVPADPDIVSKWIDARAPKVKPAEGPSIMDIKEEVWRTIAAGEAEDTPQPSYLIFQRVDGTLCLRSATIRAHMKDCARVLSAQFVDRIKGERAFSTRVINGVYPDESEYWVQITRPDGTPVTACDGTQQKPVHVRDPRTGQQLNALKVYEWIQPASIEFGLKVLGKSVHRDDLDLLLQYGGVHGYGGERGDGEGKYHYTITEVEQ